MSAEQMLKKLRETGPGSALERLADLALDATLNEPVSALLPQGPSVAALRALATGWCETQTALDALAHVLERVVTQLKGDHRTLAAVTAVEVQNAVREIVRRPFSPDKRVVLTIIDREPTRELVRALLLDAVLQFGKKVSAPVAGVAKGLGSLARLAGDTLKSRGGTVGGIVGAVSDEVERQLEKRAVEFVDGALSGVFAQLADAISNPRRAEEAAELRVAAMNGVLELTLAQLSKELVNADVPGAAELLRGGLVRWLASDASTPVLEGFVAFWLEEDGAKPVRDIAAQLGLLDGLRPLVRDWLVARLRAVVATDAYAEWFRSLDA